MKILITGGAGFIGHHSSLRLLGRGDEVVLIDNFNDYYDPRIKESRVERMLERHPEAKLYRADISDYDALEKIIETEKPDKIFHLAAQAGVRYSLKDPFRYIHWNVLGTLNLLELCRHKGVKDFIYASSSSVYGKNKDLPFSEEHRVHTPMSLYASTKKSCEEMAHVYHHLYGVNTVGLRFFTVYGPWGRPDMALFKFTKNILEGKPIDVYNSGKMARDFTYVEDIVSGAVAAIDSGIEHDIFNLARGESVRLMDFIEEAEKNLGIKAEKNLMPMQPGDVPATSADISRAREKLGYDPQTSVAEGIKNFIEWYKDYYQV